MVWTEAKCFILIWLENEDFKANLQSNLRLAMLLFFDKLREHWLIEPTEACEHGWGSATGTNNT